VGGGMGGMGVGVLFLLSLSNFTFW
jgi:hypothetical protein